MFDSFFDSFFGYLSNSIDDHSCGRDVRKHIFHSTSAFQVEDCQAERRMALDKPEMAICRDDSRCFAFFHSMGNRACIYFEQLFRMDCWLCIAIHHFFTYSFDSFAHESGDFHYNDP